jgi:hypothetical protein
MNRELTNLALIVLAAVILYQLLKKAIPNATAPAADAIAAFWLKLFPNPPPMNVLGNVVMPDGSLVPLQGLEVRTDANQNVFVKVGSSVYQLAPSDANGNWPAVAVTG